MSLFESSTTEFTDAKTKEMIVKSYGKSGSCVKKAAEKSPVKTISKRSDGKKHPSRHSRSFLAKNKHLVKNSMCVGCCWYGFFFFVFLEYIPLEDMTPAVREDIKLYNPSLYHGMLLLLLLLLQLLVLLLWCFIAVHQSNGSVRYLTCPVCNDAERVECGVRERVQRDSRSSMLFNYICCGMPCC